MTEADAPGGTATPCLECGRPVPASARWCGSCGHAHPQRALRASADLTPADDVDAGSDGWGRTVLDGSSGRRRRRLAVAALAVVLGGAYLAVRANGADGPPNATPTLTPNLGLPVPTETPPKRADFAPSPLFSADGSGPAPVPEPAQLGDDELVCVVDATPGPCDGWATRLPATTLTAMAAEDGQVRLAGLHGDQVFVERLALGTGESLTPGDQPIRYAGLNAPRLIARSEARPEAMVTVGENTPEAGIQLVEIDFDGFPTGVRARLDTNGPMSGFDAVRGMIATIQRDGQIRWISTDLQEVIRRDGPPSTITEVEVRATPGHDLVPLADREIRMVTLDELGLLRFVTPDRVEVLSTEATSFSWSSDGRVVWSSGDRVVTWIEDSGGLRSWGTPPDEIAPDVLDVFATDDLVYVLRRGPGETGERLLERYDAATGASVGDPHAWPADAPAEILGVGTTGDVYLGSRSHVVRFEADSGREVWRALIIASAPQIRTALTTLDGRDAVLAQPTPDTVALLLPPA